MSVACAEMSSSFSVTRVVRAVTAVELALPATSVSSVVISVACAEMSSSFSVTRASRALTAEDVAMPAISVSRAVISVACAAIPSSFSSTRGVEGGDGRRARLAGETGFEGCDLRGLRGDTVFVLLDAGVEGGDGGRARLAGETGFEGCDLRGLRGDTVFVLLDAGVEGGDGRRARLAGETGFEGCDLRGLRGDTVFVVGDTGVEGGDGGRARLAGQTGLEGRDLRGLRINRGSSFLNTDEQRRLRPRSRAFWKLRGKRLNPDDRDSDLLLRLLDLRRKDLDRLGDRKIDLHPRIAVPHPCLAIGHRVANRQFKGLVRHS